MNLVQMVLDVLTDVATEVKKVRVIISGTATGDATGLETASRNLVGAINEVRSQLGQGGGGGAETLDDLSDVTVADPVTGQVLRYDGAQWVNVLGTSHFQGRSAILDRYADTDPTAYGLALLALASRTALRDHVGYASTVDAGLVPLSTDADLDAGVNTTKAVTPAQVTRAFTNFVDMAPTDLNEWAEVVQRIIDGESDLSSLTQAVAGKQPLDATLTALAALAAAADQLVYSTGPDSFALSTLTAYARTLLDDPDASAARDTLSVYSRAQIGDPETDLVAAFRAALT